MRLNSMVANLCSLCALMAVLSSLAQAEIPYGNFTGKTPEGQPCNVKIEGDEESVFTQIGWTNSEGNHEGCGFIAKKIKQTLSSIKLEGGSEASVCKTRISFDEDGYPLEADFGIGLIIQVGYDVTCSDLNLAPY
jgi:hypothetical protein